MTLKRTAPDIASLLRVLSEHQVRFVVTGSTAALLLGIDVSPGDLDITPALDPDNLSRLARALELVLARPDPDAPFGEWQPQEDGERRWVQRDARPGDREARLDWRPDPSDPATFDELLQTRHGSLDVVPEVSGSYDDLAQRATRVAVFGLDIWVESIADQLATLTVPRRAKDRDRVMALRRRQRA